MEGPVYEQELRKANGEAAPLTHALNHTTAVYATNFLDPLESLKSNPFIYICDTNDFRLCWWVLAFVLFYYILNINIFLYKFAIHIDSKINSSVSSQLFLNKPYSECKKFHLSKIDGMPPVVVAIMLNKKSAWIERINFVVAERMTNILDNINKTRLNISQGCENHLFGQPPKIEIGREQLSLMTMNGLFIIYLILSLTSIILFGVEIIFTQIITQLVNKNRTDDVRMLEMPRKTLETCFIDEYEQFRLQWRDVLVMDETCRKYVFTQNLQCATLIDKWNSIKLYDHLADNIEHVLWWIKIDPF